MRNLYVFAFATFGHPNDFRQSAFIYDEKSFAENINIFDLTNAIKVFPDSAIYAIRKELVNEVIAISYSIYTYAKEQYSTREGTFIGSSITYSNEIAEEKITVTKLLAFHKSLIEKNTSNDILTVSHSDDFIIPNNIILGFGAMDVNFKSIDNADSYSLSNESLVVYSNIDQNTLNKNFKESLELLHKYDVIYFTNNKDVIAFCKKQDIYSVIDEEGFEKEIVNIKNDRQRKAQDYILFLKGKIKKWEDEVRKVISDKTIEIEHNEKLHKENEIIISESIKSKKRILEYFSNFSGSIEDYIYQLDSGNKLNQVKKLYNESELEFKSNIDNAKRRNYMNIIQSEKQNINLKNDMRQGLKKNIEQYMSEHKESGSCNDKNIPIILPFIILLFLAIIVYGIWSNY